MLPVNRSNLALRGSSGGCYADGRVVRRVFANSFLSLLLITTLVWGGCVSCEKYFMWPGVKSCCTPGGHCKNTKSPEKPGPGSDCKQLAFEHHKSFDHHFDLPVVTGVIVSLPVPAVKAVAQRTGSIPPGESPPDLQVLHSIFRL